MALQFESLMKNETGERIAAALESMAADTASLGLQVGTVESGDTAKVTITDGKLNFVLPKGDSGKDGSTGEKGEKGDKGDQGEAGKDGVGISDTEKSLMVKLFRNAAYGNSEMQSILNSLCTSWGVSVDESDTETVPLVYELAKATTFNPVSASVVDTGVKLFEDITNPEWTILLDYTNGTSATATGANKYCIMHCMDENSPYPGISIANMYGSTGHSQLTIYNSRQNITKNSSSDFAGRNTKIAIIIKGSTFKTVCQTSTAPYDETSTPITEISNGWYNIKDMSAAVSQTLILGGYRAADGSHGRYFDGTINTFKVYKGICSDSTISSFVYSSSGGGEDTPTEVVMPDAVYSLNKAKTFTPSNKDYIDTGVKLFENVSNDVTWTIAIQAKTGENLDGTVRDTYSILHCMDETSPWPGLNVAVWPSGIYGVNVYNTANVTPQISVNTSKTYMFKLLFKISDGSITAYTSYSSNESINIGDAKVIGGMTTSIDKDLLIGCYQQSDGTKGRFWDGTVYKADIYKTALTDEQINKWMNDWTYNE